MLLYIDILQGNKYFVICPLKLIDPPTDYITKMALYNKKNNVEDNNLRGSYISRCGLKYFNTNGDGIRPIQHNVLELCLKNCKFIAFVRFYIYIPQPRP